MDREDLGYDEAKSFVDNLGDICKLENKELKERYLDLYRIAERHTIRKTEQGAESLYHNLNTLESRAGSQVPFTSINFGTDTTPEGRLVTKSLLKASINGIGEHHKTSIFPISIFKYKKDVNGRPGTPNYDLFQLALESLSKRIYPNIVNCDVDYIPETVDPDCMNMTMGCVEGDSLITYKYKGALYVESIGRMWDRLSNEVPSKQQTKGDDSNLYKDAKDLEIYDTIKKDFVKVKRVIRNTSNKWVDIKISNGRYLRCTDDHPFYTENRGRVLARDLEPKVDRVIINPSQYSEEMINFSKDKAWLLGFLLCDGCYANGSISSTIHSYNEDDIEVKYRDVMLKEFNLETKTTLFERGSKGNYKSIRCIGSTKLERAYLTDIFGGLKKIDRHIPNEVFSWDRLAKLNFLTGMIDADGHVNPTTHGGSSIQIGSTNRELAYQQLALVQSLGIPAKAYVNHYNKENPTKVRIMIEFRATDELINLLASKKKRDKYIKPISHKTFNCGTITSIEPLDMVAYSYDVETESDFFEVNNIYSHNCRTATGFDRHGMGYHKGGRGNICPATMNLVKLGLDYGIATGERSEADLKGFEKAFEDLLKLTEEALLSRYEWIASKPAKSGFFMHHNGIMKNTLGRKLKPNEEVRESMKHNTLAIGYIGIAECMRALFGKDHADSKEVYDFAYKLVERIHNFAKEASDRNDLNFSCYATPAESTCMTLRNKLVEQYGIIEGITDRDYITNSHHISVFKDISIFKKIDLEAPFSRLATGGYICYVELESSIANNKEAVERIIHYAMDKGVAYFALNFPIDTCKGCGFSGEINTDDCPECGSNHIERLRRVTGYLTTDYRNFNKGKQSEVHDRIKHTKFTKLD